MLVSNAETLRRILQVRPLAISILEKESTYKCWDNLDKSCADFCQEQGLDCESLMNRLANLPPVSPDSDWATKPLYYLIDYLTQNHVEFRDQDLPAITALLKGNHLPAFPDGYVIKLVVQEFRYFQHEFLRHMDEEEMFVFPKIMRNEACFRHRELGPEVYKGSVNLYLKLENHKPEVEFKRLIVSIREKLRNLLLEKPAAERAHEVQNALEAFERRLLAHADLETDLLFPRAGRLEQELYESSLPGYSRYPGDR